MNIHFKKFFEFYFDYSYEKLEFFLMDKVNIEIANTYQLAINDIETFFIYKKTTTRCKINYYGFLRVDGSDFYIPIDVLYINGCYDPLINLEFHLTIRNSIFGFKFIPLKYNKTCDYINELINQLPEPITNFVSKNEKEFTFLNVSFMDKFSLYFDLKSTYTQIQSRSNKHYNELRITQFYNEQHIRINYTLNIKGENELLSMFLSIKNTDDFNCQHLLSASFDHYDSLMTVDSSDFITMRNQLIQYRKINSIYTY